MTKETLQYFIDDDEFGLLDLPVLSRQEQEMVDAFVPFILNHLNIK